MARLWPPLAMWIFCGAMRLRIPELLTEREPKLSAYKLHKLSGGRISHSTASRLVRLRGRLQCFDSRICEVLCEVLKIEPAELFKREPYGRWRKRKRRDGKTRTPTLQK
jgi:hypothetical protein